jgi:PUA domain protein
MSPPLFPKLGRDQLTRHEVLRHNRAKQVKVNAAKYMPRFPEITGEVFPGPRVQIFRPEDHVSIYTNELVPVLVQTADGHIFPHLRVALEYRGLLPSISVDDGAVRALLKGATLMAPGIREFDAEWVEGDVLEVRALGADLPFAIGIALMASALVTGGSGKEFEIVHILKDGLWDLRGGLL